MGEKLSVFRRDCTILHSTGSVLVVQVQQFLLAFGSFLFSFSCLYGCIVVFHCVFNLQFPSRCHLEKAMAPHSSTRAWKIPWTEESGAG